MIRRAATVATFVAMLLAALLLLYRLFRGDMPAIDFGAQWAAGRVWNEGGNPYGPAFQAAGARLFDAPAMRPVAWFYPPQWWWLAAPFSLLDFQSGARVWSLLGVGALGAGAALLWRAAGRMARPVPLYGRALFVAVLVSMEAASATLYLGQTGFLMFLGLALLGAGLIERRHALTAAGLTVLLLKPQLGLPCALLLFAHAGTRKATIFAGGATALACVPALLIGGPVETVTGWLGVVSRYKGYHFNLPAQLTGASQIAALGQLNLSMLAYVALAVALLAGLWLLARARNGAADGSLALLCLAAGLAAAIPLHNYDLSIAIVPLLFVAAMEPLPAVLTVLATLILYRPRALAGRLFAGDILETQAALASTGLALLLLAAALVAWRGWRARPST